MPVNMTNRNVTLDLVQFVRALLWLEVTLIITSFLQSTPAQSVDIAMNDYDLAIGNSSRFTVILGVQFRCQQISNLIADRAIAEAPMAYRMLPTAELLIAGKPDESGCPKLQRANLLSK